MAKKDSLAEIAKLPPEARAYLTSLQKKIEMYDKMTPGGGSNVRKSHVNESKRLAAGKAPNRALVDKKYGPPAGSKPKPRKATSSTSKSNTSRGTSSSRTQGPPAPRKAASSTSKSTASRSTSTGRTQGPPAPRKATSSTSKTAPAKKKSQGAISGSVIGKTYRQFERMEPGRTISKLFR